MKRTTLLLAMLATLSAQAEELPTIVVDAGLIDVESDDLSRTVSIMSRQEIERSGQTNAAELLARLPGVSMDRSGAIGTLTNISIRGLRGKNVRVMIDGNTINNSTNSSPQELATLSASMIERIEVVRGGNSALGGENALSGSINIVSRRANFVELTSRGKDGDSYAGGISLESGNTKVFAAINGQHNNQQYALTDRVQKLSLRNSNGQVVETAFNEEVDENEAFKFTAGADFAMTDQLAMQLRVRQADESVEFDDGSSISSGETQTNFSEQSIRFNYKQNASISHFFSAANYRTKAQTIGSYPSDVGGERITYQYRLNARLGQSNIALDHSKVTNNYSFGSERNKANTDSTAIEFRSQAGDFNYYLGYRNEANELFDTANTAAAGLTFFASDDIELFANHSTNVRNPNMQELFGYYGKWKPNPNLKPESAESSSVGARWFGAQSSVEMAIFSSTFNDKITGDWANEISYNIDDKTEISGIEITANTDISDKISLDANLSLVKAEDANGEQQVLTPEQTANVNLSYQHDKITAVVGLAYTSATNATYIAPDWTSHKVELPSRELVNLGLSYELDERSSISLDISNAFDDDNISTAGYAGAGRSVGLTIRSKF